MIIAGGNLCFFPSNSGGDQVWEERRSYGDNILSEVSMKTTRSEKGGAFS